MRLIFSCGSDLGASGFHVKCPYKHHFPTWEQVEGFGAPLKMSLLATVPSVGSAGKLQMHLGNYISARARNLSISHSQNDDFEAFLTGFGHWPFQAHCNITFLLWAAPLI